MLPCIEVAQLARAASLYSAVSHPLGIRYLSASPSSIVYGADNPDSPSSATLPLFEVRQVPAHAAVRRSRIVVSALSAASVSGFHAAAQRASPPDLQLIGIDGGGGNTADDGRAELRDFDGNIMEVVYNPPPNYPAHYSGSTIRRTQSSTKQVNRILDWNFDVATSEPATQSQAQSLTRRSSGGEELQLQQQQQQQQQQRKPPPYAVLRRSVTTSTLETSSASPSAREASNGLSTGAIVGAVVGAVAAGAAIGGALTYMNMKHERHRAPVQEFDPPDFQRRSSFPDPYPHHRPRYVEVERTVEKVRYPEDYPAIKPSRYYPPPSYIARYSQAGGTSREVEELDDRASRQSQHSSRHSSSRLRARSETGGSTRRPRLIADAEHQSSAGGSRYTTAPAPPGAPKMLMDTEYRSQAGSRHSTNLLPEADNWSRHSSSKQSTPRSMRRPSMAEPADADTYVSARSQRTESTVRPSPAQLAYSQTMPVRSATMRHPPAAGGDPRVPMSRAASYASARLVPLPPSNVGSSHAAWDDDTESLAPSDSISCVGTRRSGRGYH